MNQIYLAMKTRTILTIFILLMSAIALQAQEIEDMEELVESGTFLFVADRAFPSGGRSVSLLNRPNKVEFNGENATGDLAYFGRAHNPSVAYNPDGGGIKFDGEMMNKEVKVKKKKIILSFKMSTARVQYNCFLTISGSGSATLSIDSSNQSSISYNGAVTPVEEN